MFWNKKKKAVSRLESVAVKQTDEDRELGKSLRKHLQKFEGKSFDWDVINEIRTALRLAYSANGMSLSDINFKLKHIKIIETSDSFKVSLDIRPVANLK